MRTRFKTDAVVSATSAQTGATVATANATTPGTGADATTPNGAEYTTCAVLANALKTDYNKTITDIANIKTEVAAIRAKLGL